MSAVEELRAHFEGCPLPPDAGCEQCHAYEKQRRIECHGSINSCLVVHGERERGLL